MPSAPGILELVERRVRHVRNEPERVGQPLVRDPRREASARSFWDDMPQLALAPQQSGNSGFTDAKALCQFEVSAPAALVRGNNSAPQV